MSCAACAACVCRMCDACRDVSLVVVYVPVSDDDGFVPVGSETAQGQPHDQRVGFAHKIGVHARRLQTIQPTKVYRVCERNAGDKGGRQRNPTRTMGATRVPQAGRNPVTDLSRRSQLVPISLAPFLSMSRKCWNSWSPGGDGDDYVGGVVRRRYRTRLMAFSMRSML